MRVIRINKYLLYSFIAVVLLNCSMFKTKPPDNKKVKSVVQQLQKEETAKNNAADFFSQLINDIAKWINSNAFWFKIAVISVIAAGLFLLIYFVIRYIVSGKYKYQKNLELKKEITKVVYDEKYLEKLLNANNFSQAMIYLHHYSIYYLISNKISYKKNMTNNDFYKKIKDKNQAEVFKKIYTICEKILFDNYTASGSEYNECFKDFNKYYLVKQEF